MKFVSAGILACIIAIHGAAQSSSKQSQPSGIDVTIRTRGSFSKAGKSTKGPKPEDEAKLGSVFTANSSSKPFPLPDSDTEPTYDARATGFPTGGRRESDQNSKPEMIIGITNRTAKKIRHIEWEIIFNDRSKTTQASPLRFTNQTTIAPGAMRPLVQWKDLNKIPVPLQEYVLSGRITWRVVITQIRYEDGSVWKAQP